MGKKTPKSPEGKDITGFRNSPFASLGERVMAPVAAREVAPDEASPATPEPKPADPAKPGRRGRVVLRRETKHRGGRAVVIASGFRALPAFDARELHELAQRLKRELGCGGTVDDERGEIVVQGDRPAQVAAILRELGFRVDGVTS